MEVVASERDVPITNTDGSGRRGPPSRSVAAALSVGSDGWRGRGAAGAAAPQACVTLHGFTDNRPRQTTRQVALDLPQERGDRHGQHSIG